MCIGIETQRGDVMQTINGNRMAHTAVLNAGRMWWVKRLSIAMLLITVLMLVTKFPLASAATAPRNSGAIDTAQSTIVLDLGNLSAMDSEFSAAMNDFSAGNHQAATTVWNTLALQGHVSAQFNLGIAYATGSGVDLDLADAARWWREAAYQGHTDAQYNLGLLYAEGKGVPQSSTQAAMWWYMAAIGGDPAAQFQLGALAALSDTPNLAEAAFWWSLSASQGFSEAVQALELLKSDDVMSQIEN